MNNKCENSPSPPGFLAHISFVVFIEKKRKEVRAMVQVNPKTYSNPDCSKWRPKPDYKSEDSQSDCFTTFGTSEAKT